MKAQLVTNSMRMGSVARDYVRLVYENQKSSTAHTQPKAPAAHEVLESFEDQDRSLPVDPIVPIKPLVRVMTESLRGAPNLASDDGGRIEGAKLYKGLKVRLRGIPERQFVVREVFWDLHEVRVEEMGTEIEYLLPWDCLEIIEEQKR